jgi:hypothetical protein
MNTLDTKKFAARMAEIPKSIIKLPLLQLIESNKLDIKRMTMHSISKP